MPLNPTLMVYFKHTAIGGFFIFIWNKEFVDDSEEGLYNQEQTMSLAELFRLILTNQVHK